MAQRPHPIDSNARLRAQSSKSASGKNASGSSGSSKSASGSRNGAGSRNGGRSDIQRQPIQGGRPRPRTAPASTPRFSRAQLTFAAIVAVVLIGLGGLAVASWARSQGTESVAGASGGGQAPWPADPSGTNLQSRLSAAGLPALSAEGEALHIHQHLDIYIHGQQVPVPANIGIDQSTGMLSPIHTHDDTGVIHVESPTVQDFFLGQLFQVWGVTLNSHCIGGYCTDASNHLRMWVNGQAFDSDPGTLKLAAHQEIVIAYGNGSEVPSPIPSTYSWNGL